MSIDRQKGTLNFICDGCGKFISGDDDFGEGLCQLAPFDHMLKQRLARDGMQRLAGKAGGSIAGGDDAENSHGGHLEQQAEKGTKKGGLRFAGAWAVSWDTAGACVSSRLC